MQFFSNDALIITETKELLPSGEEIIPGTMKSRPYNTIIENRRQYIEKLRNYFDNHIKISIGISNKIIRKHPQYPEVYGVNFFQIWDDDGNSSIIENKMPGYIFMMVDFRDNEMEPVIHVRTWQPQANISKPSDKYTLSDFCIISTR